MMGLSVMVLLIHRRITVVMFVCHGIGFLLFVQAYGILHSSPPDGG